MSETHWIIYMSLFTKSVTIIKDYSNFSNKKNFWDEIFYKLNQMFCFSNTIKSLKCLVCPLFCGSY